MIILHNLSKKLDLNYYGKINIKHQIDWIKKQEHSIERQGEILINQYIKITEQRKQIK